MGSFWMWVFLMACFQASVLPLLSAAPSRFSFHFSGARATKLSTLTQMLHDTPDQKQLMPKNMKDDDPNLKLEDYKPIDPSPDSSTYKLKPSPIQNGVLINPFAPNPH
ncbi:unnamed protein product [Rhodiola kirilowii]